MMRLIAILHLLGTLAVAVCMPAAAQVHVVDETNGTITVEVEYAGASVTSLVEPGRPPVPYVRVFVAVPHGARLTQRTNEGAFKERQGGIPEAAPLERFWPSEASGAPSEGFYPRQPYRVSESFVFRKTRIVAVDFYAAQFNQTTGVRRDWDGYGLTLDYGAMSEFIRGAGADPLVAGLVANERFFPQTSPRTSQSRSAMPDPHFSLSRNWVKIGIDESGVYRISGSDLAGIGINIGDINDPGSFRLFTAGGRSQNRDLTVPGGTWEMGTWMSEVDLHVEYGGDGTFDPADYIVFSGRGSEDWLDRYAPGSPRDGFYRHAYTGQNYYYLSWDDTGFTGAPARMATANAAPNPANASYRTYEERRYFEEDRVEDFDFGGDGWLWVEFSPRSNSETRLLPPFALEDLVTTEPQTFRTVATSSFRFEFTNTGHHAEYRMNGQFLTDAVWDTQSLERFDDAREVSYTGSFLVEGQNTLSMTLPRDLNESDFAYFAWYAVFYERKLKAIGNALTFSTPDTIGNLNLVVEDFETTGDAYVYDVTEPNRPVRLTGFAETTNGGRRSIEVGAAVAGRHYYTATTTSGMFAPASMSRHFPRDIRNVTQSPHMVIIVNATFASAAARLQAHRLGRLPYFPNGRVQVTSTEEVFDNFSGGQTDPMAIRNYMKFLYDNFDDGQGNPEITYLCLLGDANDDFRNNSSSLPNYVTSNLQLYPFVQEAFATDDWFALMDPEDTPGRSYADIAVGRLPAATSQEANFLVDRVIAYETQSEFGTWRDRVILVADDEQSPSSKNQADFIIQSESIAHGVLPDSTRILAAYMEPLKVYLTEFPSIQGIKPASRLTFLNAWNRGALLINYIGHGSSVQMADEQVFLASDVGNLLNGLRLPLFMAVSCTIGDYASPLAKSLSERLLLHDGGGVIATITASEVTFIGPNATFDFRVFENLFSPEPGLAEPIGVALMRAKFESLNFAAPNRLIEENNQKYNLMGDPALRLVTPQRRIQLTATEIDTLTTGKRQTISGTVLDAAGDPDLTFSGNVTLVLREPDDPFGYTRESDGFFISYRYPGGTIYNGSTTANGGNFQFSFTVPRSAETGLHGFVQVYANNNLIDAIAVDDQPVFVSPSPGDTTVVPLDGPPRVSMGFKDGETTAKPGSILRAVVRDSDGINTLDTTPEGRLALVFDGGLPIEAGDFFTYDIGGVDTAGTLLFPLPELEPGDHSVIFKVADTFGQTRLDTLSLVTTRAGDFSARVTMNYPNPFQTETYFLVEVSDNAQIRLDIFTVSGKQIRSLQATSLPGKAWVKWDGRDTVGDEVANGVYLYVARVDFPGTVQKTQVLRGSVSKVR